MAIFEFSDSNLLGSVIGVDTRKIHINVESKRLGLAKVGGLVAIKAPGGEEKNDLSHW